MPSHSRWLEIRASSHRIVRSHLQSSVSSIPSNFSTLAPIRYSEPKSFEIFASRCQRPGLGDDAASALAGLLDAVIDYLPSPADRGAFPASDLGGEEIEVATGDGEPVTMRHLLQAARGEYAKLEKPLHAAETKGWA